MSDLVFGSGRGGPPPVRPAGGAGRTPADQSPRARVEQPSADAPAGRADVRLDPRMAARRIAVRRDEGRRRLNRLLVALAVAVTLALAGLSTRTPLLDVDHVRVEGASAALRSTVVDAVDAAGAGTGTPMLDVDTARLAAAVEDVPTIASADVVRRWPGTLVVQVRPRIPVASVGGALIAEDGVVVAIAPAAAGVPLVGLDGVEAPTEAGAHVEVPELLAVAAALPDELRGAVAAVRAGPAEGEVDLRLTGGGIARLGAPTDLGSKLVAVVTVLEQVELDCLATIDARVPSAPAVTRAAGCAA